MEKLKQFIKNSDTRTRILLIIVVLLGAFSIYQGANHFSLYQNATREKEKLNRLINNQREDINELETQKEELESNIETEESRSGKYDSLIESERQVALSEEKLDKLSFDNATSMVNDLDEGYFKTHLSDRLSKIESKVLENEKLKKQKADEAEKKKIEELAEKEKAEKEAAEKEKKEQEEQAALEAKKKEEEEQKAKEDDANKEKLESGDITYLANEPSTNQKAVLQELAEQQFEKLYPFKGSKIHSILGVIQNWTTLGDKWFYKAEATIVNAYDAERSVIVEITIEPTESNAGLVSIQEH